MIFGGSTLSVIFELLGILFLIDMICKVLKDEMKLKKENPRAYRLGLDQDTLDQNKLESEGHKVIWQDGEPSVLFKKDNKN